MTYNEQGILKELDDISSIKLFPSFEISYFYPANSRINLFADEKRWGVVFEILCYNRMTYRISIDKYYFSNCFVRTEKQNQTNLSFIPLSNIGADGVLNEEGDIDSNIKFINVRDQVIPIERDIAKYTQKGIKGSGFEDVKEHIDIVSLTRYLSELHPNYFKATNLELKSNLPKDIPFLGSIENWYHTNCIASSVTKGKFLGTMPSQNETFQLIAKCLVNQDMSFYKPTLSPNSHWRNWPRAGQL